MRAARLHGARDLRLDDVPEPRPGASEVLLRPRFTGLCGSDLHLWHAGPSDPSLPITLGHEFSAEVVEVGEAVADPRLRPGALVTVEPMWTCGTCAPCRRGDRNLCRALVWHGLSRKGGALADLTVVAEGMVHPLPAGVDARAGALVEPLAVAHHAVGRSRVGAGGSAAVLGAGPIGIAATLDLAARGVGRIAVSEPAAHRRAALAGALAALAAGGRSPEVVIVDPADGGLDDAVRELTDGDGVDAVIDAAGVEPAFQAALGLARPGGTIVTVAVYLQPVTFHPLAAFFNELDLAASCAYRGDDFPSVIDLVAKGAFPAEGWVRTVALDEVGEAFAALDAAVDAKVLVEGQ